MVNSDLLSSDDEGKESGIVINKRYAKDFQLRKQLEDLRNNPLLSDDHDDDDASTSSSEDEDGALLTTKRDTDILKTINAIRSKDSRIYDPQVNFFHSDEEDEDSDHNNDDDESDNKQSRKKRKPKRYKDVVREQALEKIQDQEEESDAGERATTIDGSSKSHRLAYDKEQELLRKSFLKSTEDSGNESDDGADEDGLLVVKRRAHKEDKEIEKEFMQEMARIESTMASGGKSNLVDPKGEVDDASRFLVNFFKNRSWIDKDNMNDNDSDSDSAAMMDRRKDDTAADELVPMKSAGKEDGNESDASLEQLDKTDDFESQYNFRFEEAAAGQSGADFSLMSYARGQTVNTLRRKDESRREKRLARKERKAAERKAKEEELKRLKNIKRMEMERKLNEVKKVVGLVGDQDGDLDEAALLKLIEGDYDPEEFEKKMQETFGDDFYSKEDKEWKSDKDIRDALIKDEDGNLLVGQGDDGDMYDAIGDDSNEQDEQEAWNDDEENNEEDYMEEDFEGQEQEDTQLEKKIKSKMKDELYKLDYEDIVAGMPTRFKYRQVEANNYGLTTQEILFARDTTLKQFVSLKKMAPYREDGEFKVDGKRRRRFRDMLKLELEEQASQETEPEKEDKGEAEVDTKNKRKRRRGKKNKSDKESSAEQEVEPEPVAGRQEEVAANDDADQRDREPKRKRRRRHKKKTASAGEESQVTETAMTERGGVDASSGKYVPTRKGADADKKDTAQHLTPTESKLKEDAVDGSTKATPLEKSAKKEKKEKKEKKHNDRKDEKKRDKKKKKSHVQGISSSRLSSYGL